MTDLDLKAPSKGRMKLAVTGWIAFALLLGWIALDSDSRARESAETAGTFKAAYERVCDAAHATPGTCVDAAQDLATFRDSASALGSQDAATLAAQKAAAYADGRADAAEEFAQSTAAREPAHVAPPAPRPPARRVNLRDRVCGASGLC